MCLLLLMNMMFYAAYYTGKSFHSLAVINKYYCFFFSAPVSALSVISVLFVVIVIIIVKNDHSHGGFYFF